MLIALFSTTTVPFGSTIDAPIQSPQSRGAILLMEPPITYSQAGNERIFIRWMAENAKTLTSHAVHGEMVRKFGAWIVTKTYTTKKRAAAVLAPRKMHSVCHLD